MTDLYDKIVSERNSLENLLSKIPGFKGYMEMSARREADRMIRDHVAKQYQGLVTKFEGIEREMARGSGLMFMDRTRSTKAKIDLIRARIATDTPGYSGFFASNKIGPEDLEKIYAFDGAMVNYAEQLAEKIDTFSTSVTTGQGIPEALAEVDRVAQEAGQAYDLRDSVLKGIA